MKRGDSALTQAADATPGRASAISAAALASMARKRGLVRPVICIVSSYAHDERDPGEAFSRSRVFPACGATPRTAKLDAARIGRLSAACRSRLRPRAALWL